MSPTLRRPILFLHRWLGFAAGAVLCIVAVSGIGLVFRTSLERRLDPGRFIVAPDGARRSLDELVARAKASHPGAAFESLRLFEDPTMPVMALFDDKVYVHLNPHTGAVLGERRRYGDGFGWVEGLHKYLRLEPELGEKVNGSFAFVYLAMLILGFVLWWPASRRALRAGLTLNPRLKGRPWDLNLHKTIGAYAAAFLLFSAATGILIDFDSTRVVLDWLTGTRRAEAPARLPTREAFAGFDALRAGVEAVMPGAREIYLPLPKAGIVAAYGIAANAPHPNARSYVWMTPSGRLLRFAPYAEQSAGYRLYYWLLSLHTAVTGGWIVPLLLLLGAATAPVLAWTGAASYFKRPRRQAAALPAQMSPGSSQPVQAK